jgi:hypothetical protein
MHDQEDGLSVSSYQVLTVVFCNARGGTKDSHGGENVKSRIFSLVPCNSFMAVALGLAWSVNAPLLQRHHKWIHRMLPNMLRN